ncbi:haloacid dehalogenase, partial [Listeria monocytogenes]
MTYTRRMHVKAVVFDFDGTMLDTENLWYTE